MPETKDIPPAASDEAAWFELAPPGPAGASLRHSEGTFPLPEPMLLGYIAWFCRCRWIVIAILALYGLAGRIDGLLPRFGLAQPADWALGTGLALLGLNLAFFSHARKLRRNEDYDQILPNLWLQIISDLLVLTAVVHFAGSLETYIPFAYLFHIVLACIVFSMRSSLLVTLLACVLYGACLAAENSGLLSRASLHLEDVAHELRHRPAVLTTNALSAICVWVVVWYLAMHLSELVRRRDAELARSNRQLVLTQQEKTRHMLRTTHELKSPLATIHANIQLLLKGYAGPLEPRATEIIQRISIRCRSLSQEIQEMLQLANLRNQEQMPDPIRLDLAEMIRACVAQIRPAAEERKVRIDEDLRPAWVLVPEDHVKMLIANLLTNAVNYSHPDASVEVRCEDTSDGPRVCIEDHGIGIAADQLPRIFEEYYRTPQAVQHNRLSSGLGMAIVREVAQNCRIRLRLASRLGQGTRCELLFPPPEPACG